MAEDKRAAYARTLVRNDVQLLAPKLRDVAVDATDFLNQSGYDVVIYETLRSRELAELYHALGVSNAVNELYSWHGYGLAFDVISKSRGWDAWGDPAWSEPVVATYKAHGLHWGGSWSSFVDKSHFQWWCEGMHESPSDHARALLASGGLAAVWAEVHAD
jgi:peptidoglycan L-alanyl-D-glutamate endopeptidase CwlK